MPSTAFGSTPSLPFASPPFPLPASSPPTPCRILHGRRLAPLPFPRGRGFPSLPSPRGRWLPWHTRPYHERLRRDLQGDEEGELQPETEDILSRGEFCKDKNSGSWEVNCQPPIFLLLSKVHNLKHISLMPRCKLKCHETWWDWM